MSRKLTLVRHGPTVLNEAGRLRGWMDPPLSKAGYEVARNLALLKYTGIVYSSDLCRATQTAQYITRFYEATPALRPWNVGIYAGQPTAVVHPRLVAYQRQHPNVAVPFGEPWNDFVKRLVGFASRCKDGDVLVTHYRCCKLLQAWTGSEVDWDVMLRDDVETASVMHVTLDS